MYTRQAQLTTLTDEELHLAFVDLQVETQAMKLGLLPVCSHEIDRNDVMMELLQREAIHRAELHGQTNARLPGL